MLLSLIILIRALLGLPFTQEPSPPTINQTINNYRQALENLNSTYNAMLTVLLSRDRVESILNQTNPPLPETVYTVSELDEQLKEKMTSLPHEAMAAWRMVTHPSNTAWWWFLDQETTEHNKQNDIFWDLATAVILVLSIPLALEIIKRLWEGAPDVVSVWGTLLTLLLTASPFMKQGRAVTEWLLGRLPFIKLKYRAEIMTATAGLVLLVLLSVRLWLIPGPLTTNYNNAGARAQAVGNLDLAQEMFQRAVALNPDRVVPYHNLAEAYREIGMEEKAEEWYQKAIERDSNFAPAYLGLGELNNQKTKYILAETIMLAGLNASMNNTDEMTQKVIRYELLSNLGWSYWGQRKLELAQAVLEDALKLETELKSLGEARGAEYRRALPHFYLAQIYEEVGDIIQARQQWEESLRFLDQADWRQRERYMFAQQHLQDIEGK